jgi:hypothetical protein
VLGFESLIVWVVLVTFLVSGNDVFVVIQVEVSRVQPTVSLGPVSLELDGLLSIDQGHRVIMERGVSGGSFRVEDVVGRSDASRSGV